jgi:hypothetical protein
VLIIEAHHKSGSPAVKEQPGWELSPSVEKNLDSGRAARIVNDFLGAGPSGWRKSFRGEIEHLANSMRSLANKHEENSTRSLAKKHEENSTRSLANKHEENAQELGENKS